MSSKNECIALQRYKDYLKLKRYKKIFISIMPIGLLVFMLMWSVLAVHVLIAGALWVISLYIATFWFMSKNNCPWCGLAFYEVGGFSGDGLHFLFQKRCQHCNKPVAKDK